MNIRVALQHAPNPPTRTAGSTWLTRASLAGAAAGAVAPDALPVVVDALLDELARRVADLLATRISAQPSIPGSAVDEQDGNEGVSVEEAASRLRVSERTIHRCVKEGSIPSIKVRGRRVILLEKYLAENSDEEVARRAREILRSA